MKPVARLGLWSLGGVLFLLLTLPVLTLLGRGVLMRGWEGLDNNPLILQALWLSVWTTSLTTFLAFVMGTPLAYWLARSSWRGKRWISVLIELPIVMPPAVAGLALLLLFGRRGMIGGFLDDAGIRIAFTSTAVILSQLFIAAPFYVRAAQIAFANFDRELEDAARVDGASEWALWRFITLPLAQRALTAGLILCWARALGEFGATALFAGSLAGTTQTLPLLVYNIFERDIDAAIWTGVILVVAALIALLVSQLLRRDLSD